MRGAGGVRAGLCPPLPFPGNAERVLAVRAGCGVRCSRSAALPGRRGAGSAGRGRLPRGDGCPRECWLFSCSWLVLRSWVRSKRDGGAARGGMACGMAWLSSFPAPDVCVCPEEEQCLLGGFGGQTLLGRRRRAGGCGGTWGWWDTTCPGNAAGTRPCPGVLPRPLAAAGSRSGADCFGRFTLLILPLMPTLGSTLK